MVDKRRGFLMAVVVLVIIAFLGFSLSPLLGGLLEANQNNGQSTPSSTQTPVADQEADLLAQARGYELVLQREPDNQTALQGLLQVKLELIQSGKGNIEDVIPPLEKLSELNPGNTDYNVLLAQAKTYTGDREGAAQIYRSLLAAKPGDLKALQGLVNLLLQQERPEAAIGLLQDTLKAAPVANQVEAGSIDVVSVQLILGQVYAEQKRYDEAIAVYDEAIKGNAEDFRPVLAKAIMLREQGNNEAAQELFDLAIELAPPGFKDQIKQEVSANSGSEPQASPESNATETQVEE
ncbi:MAG: tetratricopeptide repeat protein [Okeania sp. SIO2G4]|uniref:tetratricopeptide repeat protein n=1 Tax=unclassified Okeania TaxID=2634635 RepID=UPI0013B781B0|nr:MULTISPECIES: tetratricopeptide repeat protein [unclassified Okeania]NEP07384.1 tetratricopeptide repeat protein [Okeania sp. SIO4D6]NEP41067.1 tetratricopeptide repeat protein [Okeania sp. SIO2H7]NEP74725.1 tetratricopeptide repeat protein [Okeania sp. SIO2G5]NEP95342.1 tetratricopeptide repeat protein [Okeania sp. SIO2F5]NEQ92366.1 tetratricopeptide repeat protein [Okeania sp. SIO2G4]